MFVTVKIISENPFIKMRTGVSSPFGVVLKLKGIIHNQGTLISLTVLVREKKCFYLIYHMQLKEIAAEKCNGTTHALPTDVYP